MPRIVDAETYHKVLPHVLGKKDNSSPFSLSRPLIPGSNVVEDEPNLQFYQPQYDAFIPVEFSGAAYRIGHSMVRESYTINHNQVIGKSIPILGNPQEDLGGFRRIPIFWGIEWDLFFNLPQCDRPQNALQIDTTLASPLAMALPLPSLTTYSRSDRYEAKG